MSTLMSSQNEQAGDHAKPASAAKVLMGVRLALTITGVVLIGNGALGLSEEPFFPPTFNAEAMAANFLYDIRAVLSVIAGLLVLNLGAQVK